MGINKVRAHLFIDGKVQGVFYRIWVKNQADKLNIAGWVRNLDDGRVEAVIEGNRKDIVDLIEKCQKGPFLAQVKNVSVSWEKTLKEFKNFKIMA